MMGNNLCPIYNYSSTAPNNDQPATISCTPCEIDPCQNGGTCTNLNGFFHCECLEGFNGIFCERVASGPIKEVTVTTGRRQHSGTVGRTWLEVVGTNGTSGPHFVAFGVDQDSSLSFPSFQLDFDVGRILFLRAFASYSPDGWRIQRITMSPGEPSVFGANVFLRDQATVEGKDSLHLSHPFFSSFFPMAGADFPFCLSPTLHILGALTVTLATSNEPGAGTNANFYMRVFDSYGSSKTFPLPRPMPQGSVRSIETLLVNPRDISSIAIRCFSIDKWKFDSIEIIHRNRVYFFDNPEGKFIDRYDGQYRLVPSSSSLLEMQWIRILHPFFCSWFYVCFCSSILRSFFHFALVFFCSFVLLFSLLFLFLFLSFSHGKHKHHFEMTTLIIPEWVYLGFDFISGLISWKDFVDSISSKVV